LKDKDTLLAWVWYSIELLLFGLACLESAVYGHVDGSVLLSFNCSSLAYGFNCVQRCLSIMTVVAYSCGLVVSARTGR
jgi:hypothetical protein